MYFSLRYLSSALLFSSYVNSLPLESHPKNDILVARAKSYSIVNVEPPQTTIVEKETKITTKTKTAIVTDSHSKSTVIVTPTPAPIPSPTTTTYTSETTQSSKLSAPSVVTIIVTETAEPTRFYDNGLWKTLYPVKTFETFAVPTTTPSISAKQLKATPSIIAPHNGTQYSPRA